MVSAWMTYRFQVFGGYNFPAIARNFYVDAEALYDTGKLKAPGASALCNAKATAWTPAWRGTWSRERRADRRAGTISATTTVLCSA